VKTSASRGGEAAEEGKAHEGGSSGTKK